MLIDKIEYYEKLVAYLALLNACNADTSYLMCAGDGMLIVSPV